MGPDPRCPSSISGHLSAFARAHAPPESHSCPTRRALGCPGHVHSAPVRSGTAGLESHLARRGKRRRADGGVSYQVDWVLGGRATGPGWTEAAETFTSRSRAVACMRTPTAGCASNLPRRQKRNVVVTVCPGPLCRQDDTWSVCDRTDPRAASNKTPDVAGAPPPMGSDSTFHRRKIRCSTQLSRLAP
jgi:hypothetical protein